MRWFQGLSRKRWLAVLLRCERDTYETPTVTRLPGAAFVVALVPDEDPNLEPPVHIHGHDQYLVPYEIMRWFMEQVTDQVERCRTAFEQAGPEAVE